jgi:hypothetical protein
MTGVKASDMIIPLGYMLVAIRLAPPARRNKPIAFVRLPVQGSPLELGEI